MANILDGINGPGADAGNIGGLPSSVRGIAETMPRVLVSRHVAMATNTWVAAPIYLGKGLKITGITFFANGGALSVGTHQWFGLWDKDLALLGGSADDTSAAWSAHTAKRLTLTTPFVTTYTGLYYVGLGVTATTGPDIVGNIIESGAARVLTPPAAVLDTTTALTALAATLTNTAAANGTSITPYAVLD